MFVRLGRPEKLLRPGPIFRLSKSLAARKPHSAADSAWLSGCENMPRTSQRGSASHRDCVRQAVA